MITIKLRAKSKTTVFRRGLPRSGFANETYVSCSARLCSAPTTGVIRPEKITKGRNAHQSDLLGGGLNQFELCKNPFFSACAEQS